MQRAGAAEPLVEGVGRDVVGDGDGQLHEIAKRQALDVELAQDAATGHTTAGRRERDGLVQPGLAAGHEVEHGRAQGDLDHGRRAEDVVGPQGELAAVVEVRGVVAEPAVERLLQRGDAGGERQVRARPQRDEVARRRHTQVQPPSTGSATPVIQRASGEARKQTAAATSSGSPSMRSGVASMARCSLGSSSQMTRVMALRT